MSSLAVPFNPRMVVFRGFVWCIIGLIYAPLFCALEILFRQVGLGAFSLAPAAALAGVTAFLVSANGVFYVASVRWWVRCTRMNCSRPCNVIEAFVMAVLAGMAGGSLWLFAGPLLGGLDEGALSLIGRIQTEVPLALMGGALGGTVGGSLLEAFGFRWAHEIGDSSVKPRTADAPRSAVSIVEKTPRYE